MKRILLLAVACATASASLSAQTSTFFAQVSGHQQVPSVASQAEARVTVRIKQDSIFVSSPDTMRLTSPVNPAIGMHIHTGYAGQNGPVVLPLPYRNIGTSSARLRDTVLVRRQGLVDSIRAAALAGRTYVNVHTLNYPAGEVRGQLVTPVVVAVAPAVQADFRFDAMLYGDQENPGVLTEGMGGVAIEVRADSMFFTGAFTLESP